MERRRTAESGNGAWPRHSPSRYSTCASTRSNVIAVAARVTAKPAKLTSPCRVTAGSRCYRHSGDKGTHLLMGGASYLLGLSLAGALRHGPGHPQFLHEDHRSHNRRSVAFSRLPCPTSHPVRPRPGSATPAAQGLFEIAFSTAVAQPGKRRSHTSL